jgi:hypothetical protein
MKAAGQAPYKVGLFEADIGLMISLLGATVVYTFVRV